MNSKKILIIDDNAALRGAISLICENEGFLVEEAENGKEGLDKIALNIPDLIILDHEMPVLDGIKFYKQLKQNQSLLNIPVIFCSGRADTQDLISPQQKDFVAFLQKPFQPAEIKTLIKKYTFQ